MKKILATFAGLAAAATVSMSHAAPRDYISIVGSSTVYPFATVVAENFGKTTKFKTKNTAKIPSVFPRMYSALVIDRT